MKTPVAFGIGLATVILIWSGMISEGINLLDYPLVLACVFFFSFAFAKTVQYPKPKKKGRIPRI